MNELAEEILDRVDAWPKEVQAELLLSMIQIEQKHVGIYRLSDEERAAVRRGLEEMRQGKFASEERITEIFRRYKA